jgi:hypothetical protein
VPLRRAALARGIREPVIRVEHVVAKIFVHPAVKVVGAGTGGEQNLASRRPAEFRRERGSHDAKFLQCLNRNQAARTSQSTESLRCAGPRLTGNEPCGDAEIRGNAIHIEVVRVRPLAGNAELARRDRARGGSDDNAWSELKKCVETSSIEGQVLHELPVDHRADRRRFRVDKRGASLNRDNFRYRTQRKREVDRQGVLYVYRDVRLDDRLEADFGNLHSVIPGRKIRDNVNSFVV